MSQPVITAKIEKKSPLCNSEMANKHIQSYGPFEDGIFSANVQMQCLYAYTYA